MADRAAVSLDQTASPHPPLPRQQRQRDPPPALCRDDRLRAAAHRRPLPLRQALDPPLHRSGRPVPLRTPPHRRHQQTPARQPKPSTMPKLQKPAEPQLRLSFPGQPCRLRGEGRGEGQPATGIRAMTKYRVGVDIGGTFTDIVFLGEQGERLTKKVPSTVDNYATAIVDGLAELIDEHGLDADIVELLHGTTVASNAILELRGARTGLITTRGFRDVLEIRTLRMPRLYDLSWTKPPP